MTLGRRRAKKNQGGFALLLVFLLAAAVALMLYRQVPREAFESERDKEQMLIDRGEQVKRAIYLYYVQNNRQWPSKIEDLENTNNHRYLRHRYVDPYTGKDEWRLIHTNGTFLTDSLVTPPPAQGTPGVAGGALAGTGPLGGPLGAPLGTTAASTTTDPNAPPEVNAQVQRRASDLTQVRNSNFQGQPSFPAPGDDPGYQPFNPATLPPISLYPNGYNAPPVNLPGGNGPGGITVNPGLNQPGLNQPGLNQPGLNQPGAPGVPPGVNQPGINQPGFNPGVPGFTIPGTNTPVTTPGVNNQNPGQNPAIFTPQGGNQAPAQPGFNPTSNQFGGFQSAPTSPFPGGNQPIQAPNQPVGGFGGFTAGFNPTAPVAPGTPGAPSAVPPNQALNLINNLLTTPRQPPAGIGPNQSTNGGGLAGIASTFKGATIKSYADRAKYQEWEFVFQVNSLTTLQGAQRPGALGGPGGGPGGPGTPGAPGAPGIPPGAIVNAPGGATGGSTGPGGGITPGGMSTSIGNN